MALFGKTTTTHLAVEGMTCDNCVRHVREALEATSGVKKAQVVLDPGFAEITMKQGTDLAALVAAVEAAGYTARPKEA